MEKEKPYMVEQVIKYSDGGETVIKYKKSQFEEVVVASTEKTMPEETVEAPVVEESAPEVVVEEAPVVVEEAPAESVEESA